MNLKILQRKKRNNKTKEENNEINDINIGDNKNRNNLDKFKKHEEVINKSKKIMELNDEELNNLSYEHALKYEKRSYCQYYISLIRTNHIIIFSFIYNRDYNAKIIKIDLFFISFVIYFTINALFFNDDTMHKI